MSKLIISKELQKKLLKLKDDPVATKLLNAPYNENIKYLGISKTDPTQISYTTPDKLRRYTALRRWSHVYRIHGKPARVVAKIIPNLDNVELETFHNKFVAITPIQNLETCTFKLLSGENIRWAYLCDNYYKKNIGDLGSSCMRHESAQEYLDIYCENTKHVNLAVLLIDKKVAARAIVWYPNSIDDKSTIYFDRIYAYDNDTELKLSNLLTNKKFIPISNKNILRHSTIPIDIKIYLPKINFSCYPYMDTLYYLDNDNINNISGSKELQDTEGNYITPETCDCCGEERDDVYEIVAGNARSSEYCNICSSYSDWYGGWIADSESIYCSSVDCKILECEIVISYDNKRYPESYDGLCISIDNEYFINGDDNFVIPEGDDQWHNTSSDRICEINENYYLIDSDEYNEIIAKETIENDRENIIQPDSKDQTIYTILEESGHGLIDSVIPTTDSNTGHHEAEIVHGNDTELVFG
jgi:hypothetical protein